MENDDKPFLCNAPNCGQRFANSDHLLVHQQKHQLSLNIGLRQGESLIDQTPTPTRFLPKTSEEGGELFEGLPESNPFDQDFKKATPLTPVAPPSVSTTMPSVLKHLSAATAASSTTAPTLLSYLPAVDKNKSTNQAQTQNIKLITATPELAKKLSEGSGSITVLVGPKSTTQKNVKAVAKQQPKIIFTGQGNTNIPTIIVNQGTNEMPIIGLKSQQSNTQTRSAVPTPTIVMPRSMQNGTGDSNKTTLAKQKLKEILQQNATSAAVMNGPSKSIMVSSAQQNTNGGFSIASNSSSSPNSSVNSPENSEMYDDDIDMDMLGSPMKRNRRSQDEMDPDERRKRFLERNRAAASRCRQKRKVWVQQLEKKADDLSATNSTLQSEINHLRTEVAQLKGLLLAHKDCPVTMQQKTVIEHAASGFSQGSESHVISLQSISQQHIETDEEVASSALTDMANQHKINNGNNRLSCISVIADGNTRTMDGPVNGH